METTHEFSGYNKEPLYGFGTEREAYLYLNWLNKDLEFNLYEMRVSGLTDDQAETVAFNLCENLADLDSIEAEDN